MKNVSYILIINKIKQQVISLNVSQKGVIFLTPSSFNNSYIKRYQNQTVTMGLNVLTLYRRMSLTGDIRNNPIYIKNLSNRKPVRKAPERTDIASPMLTLYRRISLTGTSETIIFV